MSTATWISEAAARAILMRDGDYSRSQADIILGHSLKKDIMGGTYYPMDYIYKRAQQDDLRGE